MFYSTIKDGMKYGRLFSKSNRSQRPGQGVCRIYKNTVETARQAHNTSPVVTAGLGRLLTAGAMMGSMMKGDRDVLTIKAEGSGPVGHYLVTADSKAMLRDTQPTLM